MTTVDARLSERVSTMPPPPERAFASDNAAGAHPLVMDAIVAANTGHALAYGADRWTEEALARFRDLFGPSSEAFLVWNGTGANVMALMRSFMVISPSIGKPAIRLASAETKPSSSVCGSARLIHP